MSVRLHRWFGLPPELLETGAFGEMSPSAIRLYLFLCWKSDRRTSRRFEAKDSEATAKGGAKSRSLTNARIELRQRGLIQFEREPGGEYTYTLCDCRTGRPYPGNPAEIIQEGQRRKPSSPDFYVLDATTNEQSDVAAPGGTDTDFKYGHNAVTPASLTDEELDLSEFNPFSKAE